MPAHQVQPLNDSDLAQEFKDYVYIVSHDLGAPVRLMVEFARLLSLRQNAQADAEDKQLLDEILSNGERLRAMMQGLLSLSRLNTLAMPHIVVDSQKIADQCRLAMREKLAPVKGKMTLGALPRVKGDPDQIMQLFFILIDNAIKFRRTDVPPEITLTADASDEHWLFTLRDNGIGIEADDHERVFKPFQKLHLDEAYPGVGMGLALARKIVGLHGGQIWVERASPPGTTLHFTLTRV